jgi:cellulose synthase/poly-beta-1,6-N-acetylglucosamine synthase-like glycosyltransferase
MNANHAPRVSIIIPAFNSERYIGASLASVFEQTCRDYEVIVVDDGSTDQTRRVVLAAGGPTRYIYQPNQGPAAARNAGIEAAQGEFVCFLDADDAWFPEKLQIQLAFMDRNVAVGLVFADEEEFDDSGVQCRSLVSTSRFHPEVAARPVIDGAFRKLLEENFIPTSMVMVRTACFDSAGTFDAALRASEDRDLWSRIATRFPIAFIPVVLGRKRVVASSVSRDVETTLRSRIRMWTKTRQSFPDLAPQRTINALLAPTYLQLGFVLLHQDKMREARQTAIHNLRVSRSPREWFLATCLVIFSLTGRTFASSVFRAKQRTLALITLPKRRVAAEENRTTTPTA